MRSINALIVYLVIVHCGSHKNDADALSLLPEFYDSFSHNSIASQCLKITQNVAFHNSILAFSTNFWSYYKVTCLVTLFDCHFQLCKHSPNWTIFVHFKNVNLVLNGTFWEIFKHCDRVVRCGCVTSRFTLHFHQMRFWAPSPLSSSFLL